MKNFKNKTLYQQLQASDKKYFKIKKSLGFVPLAFSLRAKRQHLSFSNVRKTTICKFSKRSFIKLGLAKKNRFKQKLNLSFQNFLTAQNHFYQKKTKITALGNFWPLISQQSKFKSENSKFYFIKKKEAFFQKNKITFREYLKKRPVLSYCLSPQKMKNQNHFIAQRLKVKPILSWRKSVITIYYLLIAYKKTMRVKLNYYFNNSTNLQFFLALSPFLGYFLQTSVEKYELQYQQNTFFNKSLPGLKKPIQEINWETYAYTKYSTKLNSQFITQVNSVDDCFFISLNPRWQFKQKQLSTATFELLPCEFMKKQGSSISVTKWSFLPSRYFYKLLQENEKQGFNETILDQTKQCFFVTPQFMPFVQSEGVESHKIKNPPTFDRSAKGMEAEENSNIEVSKQKHDLKKMSLGGVGGVCSKAANLQTKFAKVSSEIRFWKNFKVPFSETNQNIGFFKGDDFQNLNSYELTLKKQMTLNSDWQIFFNELDDIPTKLNSVFQQELIPLKKKNQTVKSPLIFSFSDFDLTSMHFSTFDSSLQTLLPKKVNSTKNSGDSYTVRKNKFSFNDFKECFNLLELNYKKSNSKLIAHHPKINSNRSSFKEKSDLFSKQLVLKKKISQNSTSVLQSEPKERVQFSNPRFRKKQGKIGSKAANSGKNFTVNSNLLNTKLVSLKKRDLIGMERIQFNSSKESDQTWIHLLTKIFNRPFFKKEPPLFLDRNLQYNMHCGFSQLGNLIKLNVLTTHFENPIMAFDSQLLSEAQKQGSNVEKTKKTTFSETSAALDFENEKSRVKVDLVNKPGEVNPNLTKDINYASSFEILPKSVSLILQNAIREDLRSSLPSWISEAKNQNKAINIQVATYPFLLKLTNYETFFLKQFKFNNVVTNSLLKRPDSILELFKKSDIRSTFLNRKAYAQKQGNKTFGLKLNELLPEAQKQGGEKDKKKFSLVQRKVSGYLYPDSSRDTLLTNTSFFNVNKLSNNLNQNHSIKRYEPVFFKIISQNLLNQNKEVEGFRNSLVQVYQPLIPNLIDSCYINSLKNLIQNPKKTLHRMQSCEPAPFLNSSKSAVANSQTAAKVSKGESILNFYKVQKFAAKLQTPETGCLNSIEPDQPFTAKKEFFFGVPTVSPLYGITFKEYKEKFEIRKKDIQKTHLTSPYENSLNFVIQSNNKLKRNPPHFLQNFLGDNLIRKGEPSGEISVKLETRSLLNEITKGATFSNMFVEKNILFSPFKSYLIKESIQNIAGDIGLNSKGPRFCTSGKSSQKNEKIFTFEQRTIPYKTHFNYTKSRVVALPGMQSFSSNLNELEKSLKRSAFSTNLYEPISLKTWTLSSQLGFAFIVLKLASILYNEYREEMGYYINEFAVFFNEYEKNNFLDFLDFFNPKANYRVINKTNKKFSDLVGGRFLLTEFGEVILLLRNSRKVFYRIRISNPKIVSFDTTYNLSKILEPTFLKGKQNGQKPILGLPKIFTFASYFVSSSKATIVGSQTKRGKKLTRQKLFVEKPNLKLENFIPKGILLIGPPGTGKTLLVKALSGEASVPVIVESGKMLTTNMENNGAERLKDLFKAAREMSPCILFLDEVDTIGQKRENVLSTFASGEKENQIPNTLNFVYLQNLLTKKLYSPNSENFSDFNSDILNPLLKLQTLKNSATKKNQELNDLKTQITNQKISSGKQKYQDLIMLTQLLCELDGLNKRQEIIVIGATNRPATLDSALTRPGRFGKVIYLDLPGKQKRFELLKFYSHSKKDSLFLFNFCPSKSEGHQHLEIGSFIPTFSSFSYSEAGSKPNFSQHSSDVNLVLGRTFSKSENFLKTAFFKMRNFVFPAVPSENRVASLASGNFVKSSLSVSSKKKVQESLKPNKTLGIDENINWNYFANQTVGLSAAHLASAMNRSALKAIYIYLSQTQKENKVFNSSFLQKGLIPKNNTEKLLKKSRFQNKVKQPSLNKNSDLIFNLIQMSKKSKLKLVAQSVLGNNEILNQLTFFSRKDLEHTVKKQQPLHNFETIEYGIQTISTMNTSLQLKITKGKKVNNKIIGHFTQNDFFLKLRSSSPSANVNEPIISSVPKENINETFENLPFGTCFSASAFLLRKVKKSFPKTILTQPWSPSKNSTESEMQSFGKENKSSEKRNLFFQKHRRYLRTLAFLGGLESRLSTAALHSMQSFAPSTKSAHLHSQTAARENDPDLKTNGKKKTPQFANLRGHVLIRPKKRKRNIGSDFKNKDSFKFKNLVSLTLFKLKILSRYVNRIIQNQSLGWILLFNSTCLIQNSFFLFSLQNQKQKNLNFIYYNLLFLNKTDSRTLLKWQHFNLLNQSCLFGDSLFINRSAYYLSGKVLINVASRAEKKIDEPISLWSFTGSIQTRQKKTSDPSFGVGTQGRSSKLFLTKIQFENFILSLIAGKATETLMLANQLGVEKKNESTIGIFELKELGLLIKLMGEKYLFYSQKQLNHKQININLLENEKQINQDEFLFLKELATLFEIQNKTLTNLPNNPLRSYDQFQSVDQPWWQLKSIHLLASFNLKYGEWYRLFLAEEQQNVRNIEWIAPDTYFHNQLNNSHLILNKTNHLSQSKEKTNYFLNRAFVSKYIQFSKLNWNQIQLLESESVASYFLFESFNKSCNLLDKNREVIDSLVYSLICHESLRDFEILNNYRRYFK